MLFPGWFIEQSSMLESIALMAFSMRLKAAAETDLVEVAMNVVVMVLFGLGLVALSCDGENVKSFYGQSKNFL